MPLDNLSKRIINKNILSTSDYKIIILEYHDSYNILGRLHRAYGDNELIVNIKQYISEAYTSIYGINEVVWIPCVSTINNTRETQPLVIYITDDASFGNIRAVAATVEENQAFQFIVPKQ